MRNVRRSAGPAVFEVLVGFVRVCREDPRKFEVPSVVVMVLDITLEEELCGNQIDQGRKGNAAALSS